MSEEKCIMHLPANRYNCYNLGEFGFPTMMTTDDVAIKLATTQYIFDQPSWSRFMLVLRQTVMKDRRLFFVDGVARMACINWLRDHVHEMKAFKHWEYDLKSYIEFMIENQHESGFFYEITSLQDNAHAHMVDAPFVKNISDNLSLIRLEIEADIEYLVVEGAINVYKATGDDEWIKKMLPSLEKGINYITSDKKRWDKEHGLVKRAFTMDSWDFAYNGNPDYNRRIETDTPMSIMHGDNSGVFQAMNQLAWLNFKFGNTEKANEWLERANRIKENLDKYCWNGNFYIHQLHLGHNGANGANEEEILSLSNPYDINRGITSNEQSEAIINEYLRRKDIYPSFAEWYCINPPYTEFKRNEDTMCAVDDYINGGISSFTAGELAKAAFNNGFEKYAWDILKRVRQLVADNNAELYFLYHPITKENLAGGPSGWGAASVIDAIEVGLAGIVDNDVCFKELNFSPKWTVTELTEVRYITGYECSKRVVESRFWRFDKSVVYDLLCPSARVNCHILLPENCNCSDVTINGEKICYSISSVRNSKYVDFAFENSLTVNTSENWVKQEPIRIKISLE